MLRPLDSATLDTILVALHERRNRLIQMDMGNGANERAKPTLRKRINEVSDAMSAIKAMNTGGHHAH